MSATPPEANTEYSRGVRVSRRAEFAAGRPLSSMGTVFGAAGLLGSVLLFVAEFTTLYSVKVAGQNVVAIQTETAGGHNAYAMVPIAVLGALLSVAAYRTMSRPALLALAVLGVAALLIAVVGDLPDAHAHGLTHHFQLASNSPGVGLYLETLGGVLLLLAGGLGLTAVRGDREPAAAPSDGPRSGRSAYPV
jgi:hypothetical protein